MAQIHRTYWNGVECTARRVTVIVGESPRPTWWCANRRGERRFAVEVSFYGHSFLIDDEDGTGWHKVTVGKGSPNVAHRTLPDTSRVVEELTV